MQENNISQKIQELLIETKKEHDQAFTETNGQDTEWPMWYAGYLKEKLTALLNIEITKSELIYLLISAEEKRKKSKAKKEWQKYFSDFLIKKLSTNAEG